MERYIITISAVVEAKNDDEAEAVADEIVNAELPDDAEEKIQSLHYHDGYGEVEIAEVG